MDNAASIKVLKGNGESQAFDKDKLILALERAGASQEVCQEVLEKLEPKLFDGITTKKIYSLAFSILRQKSKRVAGRYKLKSAILKLGPSGYPFEIFVGRLFETFGYTVETGVLMQGNCVEHEVDVVAKKDGEIVVIECKFHHDQKTKTSVQVPLYVNSRFQDIEAKWRSEHHSQKVKFKGHVVTNTRFSADAKDYAKCAGLGMISWDYPHDKCLRILIDQSGLHPVTSLLSLRKAEQKALLEAGIVLCRELESHQEILHDIHISNRRINTILKEAKALIES